MNAVRNPALIRELIFGQISDRVLVYAGVQHGVRVDGELCAKTLQECVQIAGISTAVVGHFLQVLQLPGEPEGEKQQYFVSTR
jgi:hypothetical protein